MLKKLKHLKELHAKTTEGPWVLEGTGNIPNIDSWEFFDSLELEPSDDEMFIVEAHKMVPRLIEALEKCMEQRDYFIEEFAVNPEQADYYIERDDKELEQILEGKG